MKDLSRIRAYETDPEIVKKYVRSGAIGQNRLVYLPLIAGMMLVFFLGYSAYDGLLPTIGYGVAGVCAVIAVLCFLAVGVIIKKDRQKLSAIINTAPICIAKIIYGNESARTYYAIYTTGEKRHDEAFINVMAEKIKNISSGDPSFSRINSLFKIKLSQPGIFGEQLPLEFTEGVPVWRREFSLSGLSEKQFAAVREDNGQFYVVAVRDESAKFFIENYQ